MVRCLISCFLLSSLATAVGGQPPETRVQNSPREDVIQRFSNGGPQIGDALLDVAAHDARGGELRLSSLRGKYTVLVFGCLT